MKKISIIVPVYQAEKYISKCIESIVNQTYKNLEIILIDDGSTDRSGEICDEYGKKDNRIVVVHNKNKGVSVARNCGLDIATGDYITFVDSDDYIDLQMYSESLAKANVDDRMKIIELGESLDAPVRIDTYMYPSVRERNHAYNNQARLDPEMAAKARVEILRREMGEEVFAQYRKIRLDEAENTPEGEAVPGQMACRAGKSSFVVNWQGEMRSCVVLDKPSIPLRDVEFEKAWELTKKETESLRISARCSSCKLRKVCNTCVAAAIAETGKADGVPEYLCRYTEATVRYLKETMEEIVMK